MGDIAVVAICSHGDVQVRRDPETDTLEPLLCSIPEDMDIVILNTVPPAVPNLLPPTMKPFIDTIVKGSRNFNSRSSIEQMKEIVASTREELIEIDEQPELVAAEVLGKNTEYSEDEEVLAYFWKPDMLYSMLSSDSGIPPLNKELLRENSSVFASGERRYDWRINLLPKGGAAIDLMVELNPIVAALKDTDTRDEFSVTSMQALIDYLYARGVRKAIFYDFSCSVIRRKAYGVTPREERFIAYNEARRLRTGIEFVAEVGRTKQTEPRKASAKTRGKTPGKDTKGGRRKKRIIQRRTKKIYRYCK
jgi:hypothetical protein